MLLENKSIIITGASQGLGAEIARQLSFQRTRLVLFARNTAALEKVAAVCRENGSEVLVVSGDVSQQADCQRLVEQTVQHYGAIDILLNNAGLSMWAKFSDITDISMYNALLQVNYLGPVYCTKYALKHLQKSAGMVVNISSLQGRFGVPYHTAYAAAKHALQGFFDSLRLEETGVHILMVYPSWIAGTQLRESALMASGQSCREQTRPHGRSDLNSESCAKKIIRSIEKKRSALTLPRYCRILFILRVVSNGLLSWILKKNVKSDG